MNGGAEGGPSIRMGVGADADAEGMGEEEDEEVVVHGADVDDAADEVDVLAEAAEGGQDGPHACEIGVPSAV